MTQLDATRAAPAGSALAPQASSPLPSLTWREGQFFREGVPHQILSGSMHYFRIHPDHWRDRLRRLVDLGLNTLDTYVPWNFHQPHQEFEPVWNGWQDLERYLMLADEEGLDVIVRPGPFICAEWSNGGLPSWMTGRPGVLRSADPRFTTPVSRWFDELIPRIAALQRSQGGPVVAVQVENEYGSYANDHAYLLWLRQALMDRGIQELLFTADGPTHLMLDGGALDGTVSAFTLGSKPSMARDLQNMRRKGEPFFVAEFWNGWFDHWGEPHHVRSTESATKTLREIIADGGSVSLYMAHGGTNFGLWAGANETAGIVQPTITSYDSDAPIAEDGSLTPKFHAFRALLGESGTLRVSERPTFLPPQSIELMRTEALLPALLGRASRPHHSLAPETFDDHGLENGMMLHSATVVIPEGPQCLVFTDLRDQVTVFIDGERVGSLIGPRGQIPVHGAGHPVQLDLVVESSGRINYGPLLGADKGLCGPVLVDRRIILGWKNSSLPLQEWAGRELGQHANSTHVGVANSHRADSVRPLPENGNRSGLARAYLDVDTPLDTYVSLPGSGRGFVWVNDFLLGRYWRIGPQSTLYCPGPLLREGRNTITVLELEHSGGLIEFSTSPELGPTEEYIETF